MVDEQGFEARLTSALRRYSDGGPPTPDPMVLARATAARSRARRSGLVRLVPGLGRIEPRPALWLVLLLSVLALGLAIAGAGPSLPSPPPTPSPLIPPERGAFSATGTMAESREQPTLTLLRDGRVLVIAGYRTKTSAELWDPETGLFTPAGDMATARWGQTATLLQDDRVLVTGGGGLDIAAVPAEVWDPTSLTFTPVGTPAAPRFKGTSELLPDGRVLIRGGGDPPVVDEVWDPATGIFTSAEPTLRDARPEGTLLDDGRILTVDGRSATIWDPMTGTSSPAGRLVDPRSDYGMAVTRLQDGRVLVAGGESDSCCMLDSAEIWDPSTLTFAATGSLTEARSRHSGVLLDDGRVLVVGGNFRFGGTTQSAELFELR